MQLWCWLKDNSAALQALGGLLSVLLTVPALCVLVATYRAADKAARAAKDQAEAAKAQVASADAASDVARQQLIAARESAAAEREHSKLIRRQVLADLRPVLSLSSENQDGVGKVPILRNDSATAVAHDVAVVGTDNQGSSMFWIPELAVLGPGAKTKIVSLRISRYDGGTIAVTYRSNDGRRFETVAIVDGERLSQSFRKVTKTA